jgi:high-affinity K+ transport system ATPase subunit B
MQEKINSVGLIWQILSVLTLIFLVVIAGIAGFAITAHGSIGLPEIVLVASVAVFLALIGIGGFIAGGALKARRPWARIAIIVLSIVNLFSFPIGTAVGIYSLIVLFNADVAGAFD